ncbi:MAG: hypothetical protein SOX32_05650 [Candidatus Choladocola sp.]|nr:hypothetical protein [Candidatus Choladocola sp.]
MAPAYDIVSTMIYDSSTEDMALGIDGIYNIQEIDRTSFENEASSVGLGPKMAMKRFDHLVDNFADALNQAKEELLRQGFYQTEEISEMIMKKGGINHF